MEINCTIFIRELAERTLRNYNYIKERAHEDNLYEVTQLINSMYCLLVVPEEIFGIRRQDNPDSEFALKTKFSTREKNIKKYNQASRANSSRHSANTISAVFQPNISRG